MRELERRRSDQQTELRHVPEAQPTPAEVDDLQKIRNAADDVARQLSETRDNLGPEAVLDAETAAALLSSIAAGIGTLQQYVETLEVAHAGFEQQITRRPRTTEAGC